MPFNKEYAAGQGMSAGSGHLSVPFSADRQGVPAMPPQSWLARVAARVPVLRCLADPGAALRNGGAPPRSEAGQPFHVETMKARVDPKAG